MGVQAAQEILQDLIHALVVGPTGVGKSRLLELLIRELTFHPEEPAIVLLDPGGATAKAMERWLTKCALDRRMVVFDPEEDEYFLGYNPLCPVEGLPLSLQAKYVAEAILVSLELDQKDSIYYMPMIENTLYNFVYALMEGGWTFEEGRYLLDSSGPRGARNVLRRVESEPVRQFWENLQQLKPSERQQILGLMQARLLPFLNSEILSKMFSQRERTLNVKEALEQGKILLFNTEPYSTLTSFDSKVLSNLVIADVSRACFSREAGTGRPVYLFIEECGEGLVGTEIGKMLRRARKQRLHVILANQDISSLRKRNAEIFYQIWANTTHKVIFGDLPEEDLEFIAKDFFLEEIDPHAVKDTISRTFFEPRETTRIIYGRGWGSSRGTSKGSGSVEGLSEIFTEEGLIIPLRETIHKGEHQQSSGFSGESESDYESWSEVEVPWYEYKRQEEVSSRTFYSIEELVLFAKQKLKGLQKRQICLKKRGSPPKLLEVPFVSDVAEIPVYRRKTRENIFKNSGYYATVEEIEAERTRRLQELQLSKEPDEDIEIEPC